MEQYVARNSSAVCCENVTTTKKGETGFYKCLSAARESPSSTPARAAVSDSEIVLPPSEVRPSQQQAPTPIWFPQPRPQVDRPSRRRAQFAPDKVIRAGERLLFDDREDVVVVAGPGEEGGIGGGEEVGEEDGAV